MKKTIEILRGKNLYNIFLHVALLVLAIEVVILAKQNRELKTNANRQLDTIKIGDYFALNNLQPLQSNHGLDSTLRQLLFVFTTSCPFCKENLKKWNQIVQQTDGTISVVGISLDSMLKTEEFTKSNQVSFPVYFTQDAKLFSKTNKISGVPKTIIRERNGRLKKVWNGLLSEQQVLEVVNAISEN